MPYKTKEINDTTTVSQRSTKLSHFYKGFSSVDDTNSGTRLYDFDLIKQDILNHFNTRKGERVMNPSFGSVIWDLLMEPITDQVREALTLDINTICNFDPRVVPIQMDLQEYPTGYMLELTLLVTGTDQTTNMKLVFDQKLGLRIQ